MRRSANPVPSRWWRGLFAALAVAAALLACAPAAHAQYYQQLGPRNLYPRLDNHANHTGIPLVMRDAIQYLALGTRLLAPGPRIMGGEPAPFGVYPWAASLELKSASRRGGHFCGGAFIAREWVITAAHCVNTGSADAIEVLGGSNQLEEGGTLYPVDRVVVNEKYDTNTQDYDVALIHLSKPFTGKTIRLLAPQDAGRYAAVGTYAVAAGWGLTAEGAQVSNILRQVTLQIVSNQTCNGLAAYSGAVTDRMICAGFPEGGKDSCQGDSGGPLMVPDRKGGYLLAGVTSWGEGCGRPNKFGVYTRVSTIEPWVAEKIGERVTPTAARSPAPALPVPVAPPQPASAPPTMPHVAPKPPTSGSPVPMAPMTAPAPQPAAAPPAIPQGAAKLPLRRNATPPAQTSPVHRLFPLPPRPPVIAHAPSAAAKTFKHKTIESRTIKTRTIKNKAIESATIKSNTIKKKMSAPLRRRARTPQRRFAAPPWWARAQQRRKRHARQHEPWRRDESRRLRSRGEGFTAFGAPRRQY